MKNQQHATPPPAASAAIAANGSKVTTPLTAGGSYINGAGEITSRLSSGEQSNSNGSFPSFEQELPPELPLTPQSNNKGPVLSISVDGGGDAVVATAALHAQLALAAEEEGVEVVRTSPTALMQPQPSLLQPPPSLQHPIPLPDKEYARNMSALSVSTGESIADVDGITTIFSYDEEEELPDTPKSSLVSNKKQMNAVTALEGSGVPPTVPSKAVDWLPQQQQPNEKTKGDGSISGVTPPSFTTPTTTTGDMRSASLERGAPPPPPLSMVDSTSIHSRALSPTPVMSNNSSFQSSHSHHRQFNTGYPASATRPRSLRNSVPVRSPRPPRHMRAVDWCPPSSASSLGSLGASAGRATNSATAGAVPSDKTAVTSRAVRLGDDNTVTTFATMTTMGDAGSILEADTEDEASSSDEEAGRGSSDRELEGDGGIEEEESMEDVRDDNGVVDKIPHFKSGNRGNASLSGTTNHAVRASDDQSVVTFATMTTFGNMDRGGDVVDKVPSFAPRTDTSIVTNDTVQMGDNQSLLTWATTNTMNQLTGNVVDHVPSENLEDSSSNITVGTSNAVKDDPSVMTFTTAATSGGDGGINEVVDVIPTFAGGGGTGRSVISGVTSQAVRMTNSYNIPYANNSANNLMMADDRSVVSFATMTTMGDLGSIFETEVLEDDDDSNHDRPRLFSNNSYYEMDRAIVDVIPEATSSVASGTTNHSIRTGDDSGSVTTFGTLTTAGGRGEGREQNTNDSDHENDVVDKVPAYPNEGATIVSGTTNHAVRLNDDQSVATWATMTTAALGGHADEHVVDKTPSFKDSSGDGSSSSGVSETETNLAQKDAEDQSVVTWNTMTTAGMGGNGGGGRIFVRSPPPPALALTSSYAVDRVPSFSNRASSSGTTNHAVRASDDQSVVTFATMTTVGGMDRGGDVVDKVPSFAPRTDPTSIVTNDTVQMGDNQSLATWATTNTMGCQLTGYMVDHVPSTGDEDTVGTSNAVKEDPSVMTFTTAATSGDNRGIHEVVDKIPTFAGGGTGRSVISGATNQAVRMGDDRSVASFATMTTMGDFGGTYGSTDNLDGSGRNNNLVDRIPSSAESIVSGRTDNAVRLGDDLTVTTFATMTTAGELNNANDGGRGRSGSSDQSTGAGEENDALSGSVSSSSRFLMAPIPTAGILRESRHTRPPSALRDSREYRTSNSDSAVVMANNEGPQPAEHLPIHVGESVSNTHILRAISDLRFHVDYRMGEMREFNRRDSERVLQIVQQEQTKRTALEARLHSQLLLQSESMVAMELKLLRIEAKVAHRDSRFQRRQPNIGNITTTTTTITDRLPPIAATPSTPNRSDEEVDSFEELELTPRGGSASGLFVTHGGGMMHRGVGPANIAVVTRSGASVASAVTATSFQEGEFSHAMNEDERSDDGDIEDEGDDNDDGSASTPTQGSRRISNLESILLNPIQAAETNNQGISTRAVRGDADDTSTLPTSVTNSTMASTVVTSTTRGGESVRITRIPSRASEEDVLREGAVVAQEETGILREGNMRSNSEEFDMSVTGEGDRHNQPSEPRAPRSRSQSPLTVQSYATGAQSVASASLGPSIISTAAVAPPRSFGTRRANAAAAIANAEVMMVAGSRSMANRVVSFTTNDLTALQATSNQQSIMEVPLAQENDGGGDSITMPDELDTFSDVADAFSNSARAWREEYEARLDAIHKRLGN